MSRLLLLALARGGGGGITPLQLAYSMLYNGQTGDGFVRIGLATSSDAGVTWTRHGSAVIGLGAGGTWNDEQTHGPEVVWDGSQWVAFCGGYDGTNYRIGRWTSADLVTWTPYGSNPVLGLGSGGAFDDAGVVGPLVRYDVALSPPWQMWYTGVKSGGNTTLGYADSTNGISWTKRGQVLTVGTAGQYDDAGLGTGCIVKVDSTYHLFYHGNDGAYYHTGRATFTDPLGTYTKQGVLSTFSGNVTSLDDGLTHQSNGMTSIVLRNGLYIGYGTAFHPVGIGTTHEVAFRSTSTDLVTWTTPTGVLLPLSGGSFDTVSAENPSVIAT